MKFMKIEYTHILMSKDKMLMKLNQEIKKNSVLDGLMKRNMQERIEMIKERT